MSESHQELNLISNMVNRTYKPVYFDDYSDLLLVCSDDNLNC